MIVWKDHYSVTEHGWLTREQVDLHTSSESFTYTVGWVIRETKDRVVVAQTIDPDGDHFSDLVVIFKPLIVRMTRCGVLERAN